MSILSREQILGAKDIATRSVWVEQWQGSVLVRGLMGFERDEYEQSLVDLSGGKARVNMRNARARLVVMTVVDEQGNRVFSDTDIAMLTTKNASALETIWDVAAALSGLGDGDAKAMGNDSESGQKGDSISG
jgi:hypothetical protein